MLKDIPHLSKSVEKAQSMLPPHDSFPLMIREDCQNDAAAVLNPVS